MNDVRLRILETLRQQPAFLAAVATSDDRGIPWVRYMIGVIEDDLTMRFPTFAGTKKVSQIRAHPFVHVTCGDTDNRSPGTYLQIEGRARIVDTPEDRSRTWTTRIEKWFSGPGDPNYAVVRIDPHRIVCLPIGGGVPAAVWQSPLLAASEPPNDSIME